MYGRPGYIQTMNVTVDNYLVAMPLRFGNESSEHKLQPPLRFLKATVGTVKIEQYLDAREAEPKYQAGLSGP